MSGQYPSDAERRQGDRDHSRPSRGDPSPGRRRGDYDPRTTFTKKFVVVVVAIINTLYLVVEALLVSTHGCW